MYYTLEDHAIAMRHVAEAEKHVEEQEKLVAHLESERLPTKQALELLEVFRSTLLSYRQHVDQIKADIETRP